MMETAIVLFVGFLCAITLPLAIGLVLVTYADVR